MQKDGFAPKTRDPARVLGRSMCAAAAGGGVKSKPGAGGGFAVLGGFTVFSANGAFWPICAFFMQKLQKVI